jgi:adenine-specific DNA methylase
MVWDYVEIDPFQEVSGSWNGAVQWIQLAIRHCSKSSGEPANVARGDAQQLPFADATFDAVIVDPPYYDAIQYSYLSDFFFVWLKRSVGHLCDYRRLPMPGSPASNTSCPAPASTLSRVFAICSNSACRPTSGTWVELRESSQLGKADRWRNRSVLVDDHVH